MKKIVALIVTVAIMGIGLTGCITKDNLPDKIKFGDLPQFEEIGDISFVGVNWIADDPDYFYPVRFIINDEEQMDIIMRRLMQTEFVKADNDYTEEQSYLILGDNKGNKTIVPLEKIRYGNTNTYYKYPKDDGFYMEGPVLGNLRNYIKYLGESDGYL